MPGLTQHFLLPALGSARSDDERRWTEQVRQAAPLAVGVLHPEWHGIRSATRNLLDHGLLVGDDLDDDRAARVAELLLDSGCERVVLSGFALRHGAIAAALRRLSPRTSVHALWFGNFLQLRDPYEWECFRSLVELCQRGTIAQLGVAKQGMDEVLRQSHGLSCAFVPSYVREVPSGAAPAPAGPVRVGVWSSPDWRKPGFAMLAAAALLPGVEVAAHGLTAPAKTLGNWLGLDGELQQEPVPPADMPAALASAHANLYVTLSECCPMLPLESLAVGVPCLLGPTSHLFEDDPYLHERLVVPYPDRPEVIAGHLARVLDEREQVVEAYRRWATSYNQAAQRAWSAFLEAPAAASRRSLPPRASRAEGSAHRVAQSTTRAWAAEGPRSLLASEPQFERQWEELIRPFLAPHWDALDFTRVLDLAAGRGRSAAALAEYADAIVLSDLVPENVDVCRARFAGDARFEFHQGDGTTLAGIEDESLTLVYCYDSMTHFDLEVVIAYLAEFARVLVPGGHGFCHHSNFTGNPGASFQENLGWRDFMSQALFAHLVGRAGLEVVEQQLVSWLAPDYDCFTLLRKPR
jgi:ubiquinone/menaquinone biosynthesis C-methylase UbiE/glycosyltransferase involved in cell wall biosynthesis